MLDLKIRSFQKSDTKQLISMMHAHAEYEGFGELNNNKLKNLPTILTNRNHPCQCLVLVNDNKLHGYATFIIQFSTWGAENYVYLDCLYLLPDSRGMGWGNKMFQHVVEYAKENNITEIQWQTPADNLGAIRFYYQLKATGQSKVRFSKNISIPNF